MRSRLPLWPMVSTVVGVAAVNAVIGYGVALAVSRGPVIAVEPLALVVVGIVGIACLAAAFGGWRAYLRQKTR